MHDAQQRRQHPELATTPVGQLRCSGCWLEACADACASGCSCSGRWTSAACVHSLCACSMRAFWQTGAGGSSTCATPLGCRQKQAFPMRWAVLFMRSSHASVFVVTVPLRWPLTLCQHCCLPSNFCPLPYAIYACKGWSRQVISVDRYTYTSSFLRQALC